MKNFNAQYGKHSRLELLKHFILEHGTYIELKKGEQFSVQGKMNRRGAYIENVPQALILNMIRRTAIFVTSESAQTEEVICRCAWVLFRCGLRLPICLAMKNGRIC